MALAVSFWVLTIINFYRTYFNVILCHDSVLLIHVNIITYHP